MALPACVKAVDESDIALWAFPSASAALSPRDPITLPDNSFVLIKHLRPTESASISTMVDHVSMRSLTFLGILVKKLATGSPAQPIITNPSDTYSAISQREREDDNDPTSDAVKIILVHLRKERIGFIVCYWALL